MPLVIQGRRFFSIAEVVEKEGVSRQTLWRWRGAGYIPVGQRFRNGQVLFSEQELVEVRAYANRLEPADVEGLDSRNKKGETKTKSGPAASALQESL